MNKQMKNSILMVMVALLLAACGQIEPPSVSVDPTELPVIKNPTNVPEPVATSEIVEIIPTEVVVEDAEAGSSKYIGLAYWSLPENLSQGFGMLIQNKDGYGLSLVTDGANKMLWLEKISQYDSNGSPFWEVKDVLDLSSLEPGLTMIPDGCFLNGTANSEILVAHRNGVIRYAWRVDTTLDKFEAIPADGITCDSDKAVNIT